MKKRFIIRRHGVEVDPRALRHGAHVLGLASNLVKAQKLAWHVALNVVLWRKAQGLLDGVRP